MTDLPSFKHKPTCPKCTSGEVAFEYKDARKEGTQVDEDDFRPSGTCGWTSLMHFGEHIHLSCTRCSFGKDEPWVMAITNARPTMGFRPLVWPAARP